MTEKQPNITRRTVLKATGTSVVAAGVFATNVTAQSEDFDVSVTEEDCPNAVLTATHTGSGNVGVTVTTDTDATADPSQFTLHQTQNPTQTVNISGLEAGDNVISLTSDRDDGTETVTITCEEDPTPEDPETIQDCQGGGWQDYGFANQGQCIHFVNTGEDSRDPDVPPSPEE